jgi:spore coat protein U-like protein
MRAERFRTLIRIALAVAAVLAVARPAAADRCTVTATPIAFGSYNVFASSPTDSTATVTFECNGGGRQPIAIALAPSAGAGSARLVSGAERLYYGLFQNAARTVLWGDGTGGSQPYVTDRSKDPVTLPVFGRIAPGQDVAVGTYHDTVTVVVNF